MEGLSGKIEGKRIVVWDLDGTIASLDVDWTAIKEELLKHMSLGEAGSEKELGNLSSIIKKYSDKGNIAEAFNIISKHESGCGFKPNKAAVDFIIKNSTGHKMVIFSDNLRSTIERVLDELGLKGHFSLIVGKDDVRSFKPNDEGLRLIQERFNEHDKEKFIFIGDSRKDEESSRSFGIEFVNIGKVHIR